MEVDSGMVVANDAKAAVKGDGTDENDNNGMESKSGSPRKMSIKGSENGVGSVEAMDTCSTPNGEVKEPVKEVEEKMDVEHSSVTAEANGNCEEDKENLEKGIKSAEKSKESEESLVREAEENSERTEEASDTLREGAKSEVEKKDEEKEKAGDEGKDQTIIITETKSLAKAINDAVKKPDGKPTLVIIESKTGSSSGNAPPTPTTPGGSKASKVPPVSPSTGMTLRSRNRPATTPTTPSQNAKTVHKNTGATKTDSDRVALKDDAEINIYTPSLMVPYIYETSPKEKLHDFLAKIGALTKKVDQVENEKVMEKEMEKEKAKEVEKEKEKKEGDEPDKTEEVAPAEQKKEKTFFDTALGMFFVDIGLLQAQRWVQAEVLKGEKRKLDKGWSSKERKSLVARIGKSLEDIDRQVKPYQFVMKTCKRCDFKTESQTVLERHLETIHVTANKMVCSYCDYFTLEPTQIFEHLNSAHKRFGRLERPLALHQCPMCPVEDSAKARVTRHMWKCAKNFVPEKNQAPSTDFEPPAKRMRHLATVGTLKAMRAGMVVDKMSSAAALNPTHLYQLQQQQARGAPRAHPPPIRPKPGDIRLSPAYVQSVLRGQYMSSNVRGMTPNLVSGSLMRQSMPQRNSSSAGGGGGAYMLRQQNPVVASINTLNNPLQASQLFQVINPSTAGGLVPLVSSGRIGGLNAAQRFTILPTSSVNMNNRGPTPVALIPNLVTNSKSASSMPTNLTFSQLQNRSGSSQGLTNTSTKGSTQKPNISITPVSKAGGNTSGGSATANASRLNASNKSSGLSGGTAGTRLSNQNAAQANQSQNAQGQGGGGYVVCEICDGYIKDLDQLRNHMQWIHKVKIHPKMIHNRPPLNCQKCHFRFFTDQGLERHLLGSHGLVTSSMQENANKGKDGGRCIICGKVFLWKLVVHMAKDHKMTLKPAHLSYKCTVCSATFNMYRLFETHVYDEHSTVAKRVLDGQKGGASNSNQASKSKVNTAPSSNQAHQQRRNESAAGGSGSSSGGGRMGPAASSTPKPATSRITLHPEPRVCDDCGVTFKRGGNCDRHWEPTKLKPCNANLCRVDKCDSCLQKSASTSTASNKAAAVSALIAAAAAAKSTTTPSTTVKTQQKVAASANGKTEKVIATVEKVSNSKEKENKVQVAKPPPPQQQQQQQNPSDGEDVFDMEVEAVDENGSSARSDVESD